MSGRIQDDIPEETQDILRWIEARTNRPLNLVEDDGFEVVLDTPEGGLDLSLCLIVEECFNKINRKVLWC